MELQYSVDKEDWLEFSDYHSRTSPTVRRDIRKTQVIAGLSWLIVFGFTAWFLRSVSLAVVGAIVAVLYILLLPSHLRQKARHQLLSMINEGKNQPVLGSQRLSIASEGMTISSQGSVSTLSWSAIDRVESTDTHTFVFVSALSALTIPKRGVLEGDYDRFLEELRIQTENDR